VSRREAVRNVVLVLARTWAKGSEQRSLLEVANNEDLLEQLVEDLGERGITPMNVASILLGGAL
jgi:hypothetical protein